jgi:hypothetical protein
MENDDDMVLLVVKEQLTHFKTKKINEEEFEDPFAWWRTHKVHFSYVCFVVQQILGIVGFYIKVEIIFSM